MLFSSFSFFSNFPTFALAQLKFSIEYFEGNKQKIIQIAKETHDKKINLLITPELALCGYSAEDLYFDNYFQEFCQKALEEIVQASQNWQDLYLIIGHFIKEKNQLFNCASIIKNGKILTTYKKQILSNDEKRYFSEGKELCIFEIENKKIGVLVGKDILDKKIIFNLKNSGAELLIILNASSFYLNKQQDRENYLKQIIKEINLPIVNCNLVGGQDELIFDGSSFILSEKGEIVLRAKSFKEELIFSEKQEIFPILSEEEQLWRALVLSLQDYVKKNNFESVILGLSGGIDSALVLAIAVDALRKDKVKTVMMPSIYTSEISLKDAKKIAKNFQVDLKEISIMPAFESLVKSLSFEENEKIKSETLENLQARVRGNLLMAISNQTGALVLTTGNKSELAVGYCTLYGDMVGGFALIKDVLKTQIFKLAKWRNQNNPFKTYDNPIPERIITRPPSAELRENQKDEDSLPNYEILDSIIKFYVEKSLTKKEIFKITNEDLINSIKQKINFNEYKRQQASIGPKVSIKSFGKDRKMPITNIRK